MTFKKWLKIRENQNRQGLVQRTYIPAEPFGKPQGIIPTALAQSLTALGGLYRKELGSLADYPSAQFPSLPSMGEHFGVVNVSYPDDKYIDPQTGERDIPNELSNLQKRVEAAETALRNREIDSVDVARVQGEFERVFRYRKNQLVKRAIEKAKSEPNADKLDLHNPEVVEYFDGNTLTLNVKFSPSRSPKIKEI